MSFVCGGICIVLHGLPILEVPFLSVPSLQWRGRCCYWVVVGGGAAAIVVVVVAVVAVVAVDTAIGVISLDVAGAVIVVVAAAVAAAVAAVIVDSDMIQTRKTNMSFASVFMVFPTLEVPVSLW